MVETDTTAITSLSISRPLHVCKLVPDVNGIDVTAALTPDANVVLTGTPALFGQPKLGGAVAIHAVKLDTPVELTVTLNAGSPAATDAKVTVTCAVAVTVEMRNSSSDFIFAPYVPEMQSPFLNPVHVVTVTPALPSLD